MTAPFDAKAYWEARLAERFDLRGVGDIGLSAAYNGYLYRMRAIAFRRVVSRLKLRPGGSAVLDVGSGTGFYIGQWLAFGVAKLTGSDLTEKSTRELSETWPTATFVQCDIGRPLPDELEQRRFDVVSAFDMLFHIVDDAHYAIAVENFAKLVAPGGHLVFSDNLVVKTITHGPHQKSRSESEVSTILQAHGFSRTATLPMFVLMNDPVRTQNKVLRKVFNRVHAFAGRGEMQGKLLGAGLLPIDALLTRLLPRGPSTEIYLWRRDA